MHFGLSAACCNFREEKRSGCLFKTSELLALHSSFVDELSWEQWQLLEKLQPQDFPASSSHQSWQCCFDVCLIDRALRQCGPMPIGRIHFPAASSQLVSESRRQCLGGGIWRPCAIMNTFSNEMWSCCTLGHGGLVSHGSWDNRALLSFLWKKKPVDD